MTAACPELLTQEQLMDWLNCTRPADLERYLREAGVPIIYGVGGTIQTTATAINAALMGNTPGESTAQLFEIPKETG